MIPRARIWVLTLVLSLGVEAGCGQDAGPVGPSPNPEVDLTLLALGDSYTVGHSLPTEWSWPYQLADSLSQVGDTLRTIDVVAETGWTTGDLLDALRDSLVQDQLALETYGLVTLMIGVNNQFQGLDPALFDAEMDTLIALAIEQVGGDPDRVLGFSIPDYGVTPVGELFGPDRIAAEIEAYNAVLARKFTEQGVVMIDITPLSRQAAAEPALVARDGLHYSGEMYARWVSLMLSEVRRALFP